MSDAGCRDAFGMPPRPEEIGKETLQEPCGVKDPRNGVAPSRAELGYYYGWHG